MSTLDPPPEHFLAVGRVAAAAAMLEAMVGQVAHLALGDESPVDDWWDMAAKSGRAMKCLRRASRQANADPDWSRLHRDAGKLIERRHEYVHGVLLTDFQQDESDTFTWKSARPGRLERDLPNDADTDELVRDLKAVSARALVIANRAVQVCAH